MLVLFLSTTASAQLWKKHKDKNTQTEQKDTAKKDDSGDQDQNTDKQDKGKKKDYKKANDQARKKATSKKVTPNKYQKPAPKKYESPAEKKKRLKEEAEREASMPKGVELSYYNFPKEYLKVVQDFMAKKQAENPHLVVKDDAVLRKEIIRNKNIDKGYIMLQNPGDNKYTRMQMYKRANGNLIMVVEESDCQNNFCSGTLKFYAGSAGGWKDVTDEYYPQIDTKFVISRLKEKYKKEYKDLELYNEQGYEDNDANLKKALHYGIVPDEGKIVIQEQNLPCNLYEMTWDVKKDKFDLNKIEK